MKINILFLAHSFNIGGVQKVNLQLINKINRSKYNVHVLYLKEGEFFKDILREDINLYKLGNHVDLKSWNNFVYIFRLYKYVKHNEINLIHSIDPLNYVFGSIVSKFSGVRHVRIQPNLISEREKKNYKTLKITPFEKWTDYFITMNDRAAKDLSLAGVNKNKIKVIHGFNDISPSQNNTEYNLREELNIPKSSRIIISIHRMVKGKGLETFIRMIPHIIEEEQGVFFVLVGDGPLKEELEKIATQLNIDRYIFFLGFRNDVSDIIKQSSFGIYPSGNSVGMIDTLRIGKVLISKKNSAMDEYIDHGTTGFLIEDESPKEYAEHAIKLLKNKKLLSDFEKNLQNFIIKKLDGKCNIIKFERLISEIVKGNNDEI